MALLCSALGGSINVYDSAFSIGQQVALGLLKPTMGEQNVGAAVKTSVQHQENMSGVLLKHFPPTTIKTKTRPDQRETSPISRPFVGARSKGSLSDLCLSKCPVSRLLIKVPSGTTTQQGPCLGHGGRWKEKQSNEEVLSMGQALKKAKKITTKTQKLSSRAPNNQNNCINHTDISSCVLTTICLLGTDV